MVFASLMESLPMQVRNALPSLWPRSRQRQSSRVDDAYGQKGYMML